MKLLIIDGHALAFRAYYAFQSANLTNSKTGKPSGAVMGFFRMLFKVVNDYSPSHIVFTFDPGTPLERSKIFPEYKTNRKPMPEDLKPQIKEILDISKEIGFKILQTPGHEADDLIASICEQYSSKKNEFYIVSNDKDLFQLVKPGVVVLRSKQGVSEIVEFNDSKVFEELGIKPSQIIDYQAILGDSIDNVPGVKGIGEKGAVKLIAEYGNLDEIYKKIDSIRNPSIKQKLTEQKEMAYLSKELCRLKKDLNVELNFEELIIPNYRSEEKIKVFLDRGYNAISRDLAKQSGVKIPQKESKTEIVEEQPALVNSEKGVYKKISILEDLNILIKQLSSQKVICIDTETTSPNPVEAVLLGIAISYEEKKGYYIPLSYESSLFKSVCLETNDVLKALKPILKNKEIGKVGQNIKYDLIVLRNYGVEVENVIFDTMLASYLLQPSIRRHNMDDMAEDYLGYKTITYSDLVGTGRKKQELFMIDPDRVTEYAGEDADITLRLYNVLKPKLKTHSLENVYYNIELPLVDVLMDMEREGVKIDPDYFKSISGKFEKKIEKLEKSIKIHANKEFNIASTKELQKVLFDDLKLPAEKKTQTGFSTDHSVLENLQGLHPIIDDLLEHRKFTKLKSTYVDTLPLIINKSTGRIHTSYNQTIAATGRLSSTDPNLQNIPIKDEEGKLIRQGFLPRNKDYLLLSLDYSQIELRIMAHFSKDKALIQAYKKKEDIHSKTASGIFGVPIEEVTPEMRTKAKVINFSIIYGVTPFGLAKSLNITRSEAAIFIDKYFYAYPGVKTFMDEICASCEEKGYVETITGRRRYIPEIKSSKRQEVEGAKRVAINTPIQGTSADMIKIAMISIHEKIMKKKWKSKLILQVHDELVFDVYKDEKDEIIKMAKKEMESALELDVPILVEGNFGNNWDEAH